MSRDRRQFVTKTNAHEFLRTSCSITKFELNSVFIIMTVNKYILAPQVDTLLSYPICCQFPHITSPPLYYIYK